MLDDSARAWQIAPKLNIDSVLDVEFTNSMAEWHQASLNIKEASLLLREIRRNNMTLEFEADKLKAGYQLQAKGKNADERKADVQTNLFSDEKYKDIQEQLFDSKATQAEVEAEIDVLKSMEKRYEKWTQRLNIASESL